MIRTSAILGWLFPVLIELLASMGDDYFVLPEVDKAGYVVSGFATRTDKDIRLLLYAHKEIDTQSSSDDTFHITIKLNVKFPVGWVGLT